MKADLAALLMALFLLVGVLGGYVMSPEKEVIKEVVKEVNVEVPVEVPVETEILVADASVYLSDAVDDFMEYVDDEELFVCNDHEYDYDEISVSRVYEDWSLDMSNDEYTVKFNIKLEFDEDDERSCKDRFSVESFYEEDEDVEITVL